MDNVTLIRLAAGVGVLLMLAVLVLRRRKAH
jgi:LPXTG-motif cell wall-anchored protein